MEFERQGHALNGGCENQRLHKLWQEGMRRVAYIMKSKRVTLLKFISKRRAYKKEEVLLPRAICCCHDELRGSEGGGGHGS